MALPRHGGAAGHGPGIVGEPPRLVTVCYGRVMEIERELARAVSESLERIGDHGPWTADRSLGGGQQAVRLVVTPGERYVLKHGMPGAMAVAEARGLVLLAESEAVRVPSVLAHGEEPGFVLLEHITGRGRYDQARLGQDLL